MAILSFNGRVNIAVRIVTEQYPNAELYEAQGTAKDGPTTDPAAINHIKAVFRNTGDPSVQTVMIEETGYGEFGTPTTSPDPWADDVVIAWPIDMDLPEANTLKEAAGYADPYAAVTLRHPLYPGVDHPEFIFGTQDSGFVFVDTVTKQVSSGASATER